MPWQEFNNNPAGRKNAGDCAIRAVAMALDTDWDTAYAMIVVAGFIVKDVPSTNSVWGSVLRNHGFKRASVPNTCPDCYTAEDFCRDHPKGIYVLVCQEHAIAVIDGRLFDTYNSSDKPVYFYWYKEDR